MIDIELTFMQNKINRLSQMKQRLVGELIIFALNSFFARGLVLQDIVIAL